MTTAAPVRAQLVRVFLVDDTRELRHAVRETLAETDDLTVIGEADDPVDGLPLIAELQPDVVVCDLSMPRMDGLQAIPRIAECAPSAGIVIFSGFLSEALGVTALGLGAGRYVEKSAPLDELAAAIRAVHRGDPLPQTLGAPPAPRAALPRARAPLPPSARDGEDVVAQARALPVLWTCLAAFACALAGTGLSLALDTIPSAFLALFLAPVAVAGAIAPAWAGVLVSAAVAGLWALCARDLGSPTWYVGGIGLLTTALALAFAARTLLGWMDARLARQAALAGDLRRSNAELEQFAYVTSHDLAAPLRSVTSFTTLLARRYEGRLDPEADKMIGFIVAGTGRMQRMIEDLLAFARAGQVTPAPAPFELERAVDQVRVDLAAEMADRGARVVNGPLPTVTGDEPRIAQVLLNLVANAIKFCPPDRTPLVEVSAARLASGWRVDVRDNGIGVDPRHASQMFGMFQRLHGTDDFPGTGIGLAICQRIVERHGGRIWVDGFEGQGSTFSFTIPDAA